MLSGQNGSLEGEVTMTMEDDVDSSIEATEVVGEVRW